jgi:hypothetical protein
VHRRSADAKTTRRIGDDVFEDMDPLIVAHAAVVLAALVANELGWGRKAERLRKLMGEASDRAGLVMQGRYLRRDAHRG